MYSRQQKYLHPRGHYMTLHNSTLKMELLLIAVHYMSTTDKTFILTNPKNSIHL